MASTSPWEGVGTLIRLIHTAEHLETSGRSCTSMHAPESIHVSQRHQPHCLLSTSWPSTLGMLTQPNTIEYRKQRTAPQAPKGGGVSVVHTTVALRQGHSPMVGTSWGSPPVGGSLSCLLMLKSFSYTHLYYALSEHATPQKVF